MVGGLVLLCIVGIGTAFFIQGRETMEQELRDKLRTTAVIGAQQFHGDLLRNITGVEDMHSPIFRDTVRRLEHIRKYSPNIRFAYIMRRTEDPHVLAFVADADSLASKAELDKNGDGIIAEDEEGSYPGDLYDISDIPALQEAAFIGPTVDDEVVVDQWGALISGYAPIHGSDGSVIAVLGIDMEAKDFLQLSYRIFSPIAFLLVLLLGIILATYVASIIWRRRVEALHQIEAERSALVTLASHQLGPLVALFRWWTGILRERVGKNGGTASEVCTQLDAGVERLEQVVTTLCEAQSLQQGNLHYKTTPSSLRSVVRGVVNSSKEIIREKQLKVRTHFAEGTQPIALDRKLIADAMQELLRNAIDFSPNGKSIDIRAEIKQGKVFFELQDEGCGIPEDDIPRLFQKFARASNATRFKPHGNGLGLFLAKSIVEQAGGKMYLQSKEGVGTTISFTLPLH